MSAIQIIYPLVMVLVVIGTQLVTYGKHKKTVEDNTNDICVVKKFGINTRCHINRGFGII